METNGRVIEIRDRLGELILSFCVTERNLTTEKPEEPKGNTSPKAEQKSQNQDSLMTDAQKRFLFRILSEQGMEGDVAHEHLKKLFQVSTLKEVTKLEASQAIERLLSELKGGG